MLCLGEVKINVQRYGKDYVQLLNFLDGMGALDPFKVDLPEVLQGK